MSSQAVCQKQSVRSSSAMPCPQRTSPRRSARPQQHGQIRVTTAWLARQGIRPDSEDLHRVPTSSLRPSITSAHPLAALHADHDQATLAIVVGISLYPKSCGLWFAYFCLLVCLFVFTPRQPPPPQLCSLAHCTIRRAFCPTCSWLRNSSSRSAGMRLPNSVHGSPGIWQ